MSAIRKILMLGLILLGAIVLPGGDCEVDLDLGRGGWYGPGYDVVYYEDVYYDPWFPYW